MNKGSRVNIEHLRPGDGIAECEDCDVLPPGATRERARQHCQKSGHRVRFVVEHATIYTPKEDA